MCFNSIQIQDKKNNYEIKIKAKVKKLTCLENK